MRLTAEATLLCLSVLVAAGGGVYWNARQVLRASLDSSLLNIARVEIASAARLPAASADTHRPAPLVLTTGDGYEKLAEVEDSAGRIIARTDNLASLGSRSGPFFPRYPAREAKARAGQIVYGSVLVNRVLFRAIWYPFQDAQGHTLLAVVAVPKAPLQRILHEFLRSLCLSFLAAGGIAAIGANFLARRLTVPLKQIAEAARSVDEAHLHGRIPSVSPDGEIQEVTGVMNDLLTRLETAFTLQSHVLADASHELRAPLSNLRGTVEVALRRTRTPDEYRQTLTVSLAEIERLSRLASDLLTLSRVDSGQAIVYPRSCDLGQIARQAVHAWQRRAEENSIQLSFLSLDAPESLWIDGDADRLRQVLDNLLDNALRHAPLGSHVQVTARQEDSVCVVRVKDDGPGLAPEDQERIFQRFSQLDSVPARQKGGAGLGLAIAKAITEAHTGRLQVQSQIGAGAEFAVFLPAASAGRVY